MQTGGDLSREPPHRAIVELDVVGSRARRRERLPSHRRGRLAVDGGRDSLAVVTADVRHHVEPVDEVHDEEPGAVLGDELAQPHQVVVDDAPELPELVLQAIQGVSVQLVQRLDRDALTGTSVARLVDDAHTARANRAHDPEPLRVEHGRRHRGRQYSPPPERVDYRATRGSHLPSRAAVPHPPAMIRAISLRAEIRSWIQGLVAAKPKIQIPQAPPRSAPKPKVEPTPEHKAKADDDVADDDNTSASDKKPKAKGVDVTSQFIGIPKPALTSGWLDTAKDGAEATGPAVQQAASSKAPAVIAKVKSYQEGHGHRRLQDQEPAQDHPQAGRRREQECHLPHHRRPERPRRRRHRRRGLRRLSDGP
jgi:hypothetical protein